MVRVLLLSGAGEARMSKATGYCLYDEDIRYEWKVMIRWCRMYGKTDWDWVRLGAKRFRERHPLTGSRVPDLTAA